jgi:hypothetical protein
MAIVEPGLAGRPNLFIRGLLLFELSLRLSKLSEIRCLIPSCSFLLPGAPLWHIFSFDLLVPRGRCTVYPPLVRPPLNWNELTDVATMCRFQGRLGAMRRKMSRLTSIKLSFLLFNNVDLLPES